MEFAGSSDVWNILNVPLMIMAAVALKQNWSGLWGDRLTKSQRSVLLRVALFLLLPIVVFLHELGHAMALWSVGGKVDEFHYGLMWGFVSYHSPLSVPDRVWVAFAGNLVEILIGIAALLFAWLVRAPALVAVSTYIGLLAIGGSAILYPLMSATGLYGDWVQIYGQGGGTLEVCIAVFHISVVLGLVWLMTSDRTKAIFAAKTDPVWARAHGQIEVLVATDPSPTNLLRLGWSYHEAGLAGAVGGVVKRLRVDYPINGYVSMLEAAMFLDQNKTDEALKSYQQVEADTTVDARTKVDAVFNEANLHMSRRQVAEASACYGRALAVFPNLGDALLLQASAFNVLGRYRDALKILSDNDPSALFWIDPELADAWAAQLLQSSNHLSKESKDRPLS